MFDLLLFVGPMLWLKACLSWNFPVSACTTAFCAPHVRVFTKMSLAECVDNDRFAFDFPSDVVAAVSFARSNVRIDMEEHSSACRRFAAETQLLESGYEVEHGQIDSLVDDAQRLDLFQWLDFQVVVGKTVKQQVIPVFERVKGANLHRQRCIAEPTGSATNLLEHRTAQLICIFF